MYKIGEFSKMTNLSIKTLRYYEQEGVLIPAERAEESAYRYYDEESFKRANTIKLLRSMSFSMAEIKDVLGIMEDEDDLSCIFKEKRDMIAKEISEKRALMKKMDIYIAAEAVKENATAYVIEEKQLPAMRVAAIRYRGRPDACGPYITKLYKAAKGNATGPVFSCYYEDSYSDTMDIELCLPIDRTISGEGIVCKVMPEAHVITTLHRGDYMYLGYAYKALFDHAERAAVALTLPIREAYIKGPGMLFRGNAKHYLTEVMLPVKCEN
jgi:DNA-binding transcriptional MerR regulator